jgi:uncharacterized membrane protein HdeD (DUF308 family)
LVITFSADHSAALGFLALGGFGIVTGAVIIVGAFTGVYPRRPYAVQGALLVGVGVSALLHTDSTVGMLIALIAALFGVTGVIELVTALWARGRYAGSRDWVFMGGVSLVLAAAVLLVPADFVDVISIPGAEVPPLTASVIVVGLLGAYAAIVAVYLVIAGLSLKWAPQASTQSVSEA